MSSVTILFVLARILARPDLEDGHALCAMAFGPGLTIECALLERVAGTASVPSMSETQQRKCLRLGSGFSSWPAFFRSVWPRAETEWSARVDVPNAVLKQGEVHLVLRDGDTIVRTILHTRFQNLVKKRIVGNEKKNWPGSQEAASYLAALEQALKRYASRKKEAEGPVGLVIDFVDGRHSDRVDFSFASVGPGKDGYTVDRTELWRSLAFSKSYIRRNQEHIVGDVFGGDAGKVLAELQRVRSGQAGGTHE